MKRQGFSTISPHLQKMISELAPLRQRLLEHPLYQALQDETELQKFMQFHCFVVWDFMCLLKSLQRGLTGLDLPWLPQGDPESRRLINEIVLGEESDEDGEGGYLSHFELYRKAMQEAGAQTDTLDRFLLMLREGMSLPEALRVGEVPEGSRDFVQSTWDIVQSGSLPAVAAAFTLGREDLVPEMFLRLVGGLRDRAPGRWGKFFFYLERHIQLDGEEHGPMALRLLGQCCGDREANWQEAERAARRALEARLHLWDAILEAVHAA